MELELDMIIEKILVPDQTPFFIPMVSKAKALLLSNPLSIASSLTPGLGASVCYLPMKHHHALVMPAQPDHGEVFTDLPYVNT